MITKAKLTRKEIENYLMDSMGISPADMADETYASLVEILKDNGEYGYCLDYNNKG